MQGMDGLKLPSLSGPRTVWHRGAAEEVAWAVNANHGGGCARSLPEPKPALLTDARVALPPVICCIRHARRFVPALQERRRRDRAVLPAGGAALRWEQLVASMAPDLGRQPQHHQPHCDPPRDGLERHHSGRFRVGPQPDPGVPDLPRTFQGLRLRRRLRRLLRDHPPPRPLPDQRELVANPRLYRRVRRQRAPGQLPCRQDPVSRAPPRDERHMEQLALVRRPAATAGGARRRPRRRAARRAVLQLEHDEGQHCRSRAGAHG